jgi:hypothetical protein
MCAFCGCQQVMDQIPRALGTNCVDTLLSVAPATGAGRLFVIASQLCIPLVEVWNLRSRQSYLSLPAKGACLSSPAGLMWGCVFHGVKCRMELIDWDPWGSAIKDSFSPRQLWFRPSDAISPGFDQQISLPFGISKIWENKVHPIQSPLRQNRNG